MFEFVYNFYCVYVVLLKIIFVVFLISGFYLFFFKIDGKYWVIVMLLIFSLLFFGRLALDELYLEPKIRNEFIQVIESNENLIYLEKDKNIINFQTDSIDYYKSILLTIKNDKLGHKSSDISNTVFLVVANIHNGKIIKKYKLHPQEDLENYIFVYDHDRKDYAIDIIHSKELNKFFK
jgi:hypothetical protein